MISNYTRSLKNL